MSASGDPYFLFDALAALLEPELPTGTVMRLEPCAMALELTVLHDASTGRHVPLVIPLALLDARWPDLAPAGKVRAAADWIHEQIAEARAAIVLAERQP